MATAGTWDLKILVDVFEMPGEVYLKSLLTIYRHPPSADLRCLLDVRSHYEYRDLRCILEVPQSDQVETPPEIESEGVLVHVFDRQANRIAILDRPVASSIILERSPSKPAKVEVTIARGDEVFNEQFIDPILSTSRNIVDIGNFLYVYRGGWLVSKCIAVSPLDKISSESIRITGYGTSIQMSWDLTPFNFDISGYDIADALALLLEKYRWQRFTTEAHWNSGAIEQSEGRDTLQIITLGTGEEDSFLGLNGTSDDEPPYFDAGTWTSPSIDCGTDILGFYVARFKLSLDEYSVIRFSTRSSPDDATWTEWTAWEDITLAESAEEGFDISSTTNRYLQIKVQLEQTNPDNAMSPELAGIEIIWQENGAMYQGTGWDTLPEKQIAAKPSLDNHLRVMTQILDAIDWEWEETISDWINVAERLGEDKTETHVYIEKVHLEFQDFEEDDSKLVNRVVAFGSGQGLDRLMSIQDDTTSQNTYGLRVKTLEDDSLTTQADLDAEALSYLTTYKSPEWRIRARILDDPHEDLEPGDRIRIVSEDYGVNDDFRIMNLREHYDRTGYWVEVELAKGTPHQKEAWKSLAEHLIEEQEEMQENARRSMKHYDSGSFWTGWVGGDVTTWQEQILPLGFTPDKALVRVLQIVEGVTYQYTTEGAEAEAEVKDLRQGKLIIRYRRTTTGNNPIKLQILWEAWGYTVGAIE